jgi:DNA-binding MarR family transcriptional regulator
VTAVPNPSPRYRALIQLLRTAEDLWNASRVFFARWDLSPSQFNLLNLLYDQPGGLSQTDLSRLLIMHRSNTTGLVDRLEHRGLVRRQDHPGDRRAYRVVLTPAGTQLLDLIYPHYYAAAERVWAETPESRVEQLLGELKDLADHAAAVAGAEAAVAGLARESASPGSPRSSRRPPPPEEMDPALRTSDL